ncbi:MAG: 4-(cytidine 5'-diphospho)-2-C-methyl-D-erythritol kinase [Cyclobacteriaceae bacterium]|nr:4-(cytidine 5'-diphospho)-2-C-methyl-D-erythritol kinase [Cyclobacteriaceae bacterium]
MIVFPNAKINLGLNVLRRRSDGYHEIETCFYPVPWKEALEAVPAEKFSMDFSGIPIPGEGKNIVEKAFDALHAIYKFPGASVHLHKAIPIGAGLGGGSADGAFALKLFNDLFQLNLSETSLEEFAKPLGADCAFFIKNIPSLASGIGEKLEEISPFLEGLHIVMTYPNIHISTKEAYESISPAIPRISIREIVKTKSIDQWEGLLVNDFEKPLFMKYPVLHQLKKTLYENGAIYAAMSGSGSSVFGIFQSPPAIEFPEDFTVFNGEL